MEQDNSLNTITVDYIASEEIKGIAKWSKFLSIMGFILSGIIFLIGIFAGSIFSSLAKVSSRSEYHNPGLSSGLGFFMTFIYICVALIYFFPTLFLFQSSVKLRYAVETCNQELFAIGLSKLKSYFRFWGILTIIVLSIYTLLLFIGISALSRI